MSDNINEKFSDFNQKLKLQAKSNLKQHLNSKIKKVNQDSLQHGALKGVLGNVDIKSSKSAVLRKELVRRGVIYADCLNSLGDVFYTKDNFIQAFQDIQQPFHEHRISEAEKKPIEINPLTHAYPLIGNKTEKGTINYILDSKTYLEDPFKAYLQKKQDQDKNKGSMKNNLSMSFNKSSEKKNAKKMSFSNFKPSDDPFKFNKDMMLQLLKAKAEKKILESRDKFKNIGKNSDKNIEFDCTKIKPLILKNKRYEDKNKDNLECIDNSDLKELIQDLNRKPYGKEGKFMTDESKFTINRSFYKSQKHKYEEKIQNIDYKDQLSQSITSFNYNYYNDKCQKIENHKRFKQLSKDNKVLKVRREANDIFRKSAINLKNYDRDILEDFDDFPEINTHQEDPNAKMLHNAVQDNNEQMKWFQYWIHRLMDMLEIAYDEIDLSNMVSYWLYEVNYFDNNYLNDRERLVEMFAEYYIDYIELVEPETYFKRLNQIFKKKKLFKWSIKEYPGLSGSN